ncbi:MAG: hypothetical protein ACLU6O_11275 [Bilophila wadsworthia]
MRIATDETGGREDEPGVPDNGEGPRRHVDPETTDKGNPKQGGTALASAIIAIPRAHMFRMPAKGQFPAKAKRQMTYAPMVPMPIEANWAERASMNSRKNGSQNAQETKAKTRMRKIQGIPLRKACDVGMETGLSVMAFFLLHIEYGQAASPKKRGGLSLKKAAPPADYIGSPICPSSTFTFS